MNVINLSKRITATIKSYVCNLNDPRFKLLDTGFHGDLYLLKLVDYLLGKSDTFVETGANIGSSLLYVAKKYPDISCLSCEPDIMAFNHLKRNIKDVNNIEVHKNVSEPFLKKIFVKHHLSEKNVLFWLDAHGYGFKWPLHAEIQMITNQLSKAYILIDDFKVPGLDMFLYDQYENQICSYEFIKNYLNPKNKYRIYYPNYTERTSKHHPLKGWVLIEFGHQEEIDKFNFIKRYL
ncbi:MAG: hypothetical protein PHD97_02600 [Bacteroidales bacterium]|nr:hypothetical protein [Bacteroidales bacterium]